MPSRRPTSTRALRPRWTLLLCLLAAAAAGAVSTTACSGSDEGGPSSSSSGTGAAGGAGASSAGGGGSGGGLFVDGGTCTPGQDCGDGGICGDDGTCCEADTYCGGDCCESNAICSFATCVVPGGDCVDATDCAAGEYCEYSLGETQGSGGGGPGCQGGVELRTGKCLPKPPQCGPNEDPGDPPACLTSCEYIPPFGQFDPTLKFSWGDVASSVDDVMMAPIVTQLDDDNCDGHVNERDIPDIVFFTFDANDYNNSSGSSATLHAISIVGGAVVEKWATKTAMDSPGRSIASGDIHPSPGNEVVVCTTDQKVRAYDAQGAVLWTSPSIGAACFMPSLADIDQNGDAEVIVKSAILDGETGAIEASMANSDQHVVVSDVTGDSHLEVVSSSRVFDAGGNLLIDLGINGSHAAVGDLDGDGVAEIVTVYFQDHTLTVWHLDPNVPAGYEIVRQGIDINSTISPNPCCAINPNSAGCTRGGGPPTIADFNGDGFRDVGLAGGIGYVVFDGVKLMDPVNFTNDETVAWLTQTQDCSSAQTGSSVFDFDGDGKAEVVYADEVTLHIYDGETGVELWSTCNTSGTLWEYPLVADVDSDGHADLVVASNRYSSLNCSGSKTTGIRVFGDTLGEWVRTRRIWNEHAYHVTNVNEDGTIPQVETVNYLDPNLNNFRLNVQPQGEFSAPDLVVDVFPGCGGAYTLVGRVRNIGEASVEPGVVVGFYEGDPAAGGVKLGEGYTTQVLYSLGVEDVELSLAQVPGSLVYAVVDDGSPPHPWHECRTDNNTSHGADPSCGPN